MNTEPFLIIPDNVVHDLKIKLRRKFGETIRFVNTVVLVCCDWPVPWPTHQTALLHYGGDDAATLRNCPDAITLLLVCLFHKISGLILVDLKKKKTEQTLKSTDANTPWPYPGVDNDTTLRARSSPCPVQNYYSSSNQPQEAVTSCSIATSPGTAVAVAWYVPGMRIPGTWYVVS